MTISNPRALTPYFDVITTVVAVAAVDRIIAAFNADRIALVLGTVTAGTLIIRPGSAASATVGIQMTTPTDKSFFYHDSGPLCSQEWHGITTGANIQLVVIETIFRPFR